MNGYESSFKKTRVIGVHLRSSAARMLSSGVLPESAYSVFRYAMRSAFSSSERVSL